MNREQKLVDIIYEMMCVIKENRNNWVEDTDLIEWARDQLKKSGFDTVPCGVSHGILNDGE